MEETCTTKFVSHLQKQFEGKKVLILGMGREGKSTLQWLQKVQNCEIWLSDQKQEVLHQYEDEGIQVLPDNSAYEQFQVIIKSAGVAVRSPKLQKYFQSGGKITSQLQLFLEVFGSQTLGVTGTKGKSTTSSLIHHVIKMADKPTVLAGNIGQAVLEIVTQLEAETIAVIEMSSYQLETVTISPHWAVWLNFFPEHLNYHQSLENYFAAKENITKYQKVEDVFFYSCDFPELEKIQTKAKKETFSHEQMAAFLAELPKDVYQHLSPVIVQQNLLPAWFVSQELQISKEVFFRAIRTFQPLPHRLQNIGTFDGVTFIDDTLATIPEAAVAALHAVPNVSVILLGGFDRGISYDLIVKTVIEKNIPAVALFKPSGEKMLELFRHYEPASTRKVQLVNSMEEAIRFAVEQAHPGTTVLLSPASPSFGQFQDYEAKSAEFVHWIKTITAHQ